MAKPSRIPTKKRLIITIIWLIILAALVKGGFVLYQNYWVKNDTLSQLVPRSAQAYWHLNTNTNKDMVSQLQELVEAKQLSRELKTLYSQMIQTVLTKRDLNLEEDILPELAGELALVNLSINQTNYPFLIIKTEDPFRFEQKILTKLRGNQSLNQMEYSEIKIKDFKLGPAITISDLKLDNLNQLYYSTIVDNIILATDSLPLEMVIDTYKEKTDSLKSIIPTKFSSQPFYGYHDLDLDVNGNDWLAGLPAVWSDQGIKEIFFSLKPGSERIIIEMENNQGILSNLQLSQKVSLDFLNYLPSDFDLAVLSKNLVQSIEQNQKSIKTSAKNMDLNSLAVITSLLPDKKLLNQLSKNDVMLLRNDDQYALVILNQEDQISQDFDQIRTGLIKISSLTNPSQQEVSLSEEDKAIELVPDPEQVVITPETAIGQDFYSVPLQGDKIFFGFQANFIWLGNSANLIIDSLDGSEYSQTFRDHLSNCSSAWRSELALWPQVSLTADQIGQELLTDSQLIMGSDLAANNLVINGCLF